VEFTFSPEQDELRRTVRTVLADRADHDRVRAMLDLPGAVDPSLWATMAELGWLGLLVPAEEGGAGLGLVDMTVVLEETGAVPLPGPFLSSAVAATVAARRLGVGAVLTDLAEGRRRGTVAVEEVGHGDPLGTVRATARPVAGGEWELRGGKPLVLDGAGADWALVVADTSEGLHTFLLDRPNGQPVPTLDVTRPAARLDLDGRRARAVGPPGDHRELWQRILDDIAVAACADLVGTCQRAMELAIDYAKVRVQFDRPIASFQITKHKAADMLHRLELARVGTHYAAWASDAEAPDRARAAAMAKGFVAEAANWVCAESIQVHGAVGFTWDVDCHLLYRRAKQADLSWGAGAWQRRRLADLVLGPVGS
jgi:alkylation response protein AidB-like acyl-CoA dehydrogenase